MKHGVHSGILRQKETYTGWDQGVYESLTNKGKKAYILAAQLHHRVQRKSGDWYLVHINRSLRFYSLKENDFGQKYDRAAMEMLIALHDCVEDHPEGISKIAAHFGNGILIDILWMSKMKPKIQENLSQFLSRQRGRQYSNFALFRDISGYIDTFSHALSQENGPTHMVPRLFPQIQSLLPKGSWFNMWEEYFSFRYDTASSEKKGAIIADWIFQGMISNMPDHCFITKACERFDNITDVQGLQNVSGKQSYDHMHYTTRVTYLSRVQELGLPWFHLILRVRMGISIGDLLHGTNGTSSRLDPET